MYIRILSSDLRYFIRFLRITFVVDRDHLYLTKNNQSMAYDDALRAVTISAGFFQLQKLHSLRKTGNFSHS